MEKVLAVHGLHKRFGSGSRLVRANDGITMDVKAGEVVGVLGHNGAGKTTLVNQVVGLYRPHSGSIAVAGACQAARKRPGAGERADHRHQPAQGD